MQLVQTADRQQHRITCDGRRRRGPTIGRLTLRLPAHHLKLYHEALDGRRFWASFIRPQGCSVDHINRRECAVGRTANQHSVCEHGRRIAHRRWWSNGRRYSDRRSRRAFSHLEDPLAHDCAVGSVNHHQPRVFGKVDDGVQLITQRQRRTEEPAVPNLRRRRV